MLTETLMEPMPEVVLPACPIRKVLLGQKALVTGANSGIGKGVAIALGHAGADVVVNYVKGESAAREVADEVSRCGSRALIHQADVSQEEQVQDSLSRSRPTSQLSENDQITVSVRRIARVVLRTVEARQPFRAWSSDRGAREEGRRGTERDQVAEAA